MTLRNLATTVYCIRITQHTEVTKLRNIGIDVKLYFKRQVLLEYGHMKIFSDVYVNRFQLVSLENRFFFQVNNIPFLMVVPDRALVFPSISYVRSVINKAGISQGQSQWPVVLDCSHISSADFTAAKGFKVKGNHHFFNHQVYSNSSA